jgi:hypothetical protein
VLGRGGLQALRGPLRVKPLGALMAFERSLGSFVAILSLISVQDDGYNGARNSSCSTNVDTKMGICVSEENYRVGNIYVIY